MKYNPLRIPIDECKHGYLYRIFSRNLTFGVYDERCNGFIGIRNKFGSDYLFTEFHWDLGYGTVNPKEELMQVPDNIEVNENDDKLFEWLKKWEINFKNK